MANRGTKKSEILEFTYEKTGETIRFPIGTVYGREDGPTMAVVGGMHGSEFCGIQAAIDLFNTIDPQRLKGTLIIGTIYNMPAFINHAPFLVPNDGKNPMITFPGSLDGTYSEVMAHHFTKNVLCNADYFLELHGGDIPEALVPFVMTMATGNHDVDKKSEEMAKAYNIKYIIRSASRANSKFGAAFAKMSLEGVPSLLAEVGQQGILNLDDAKTHLDGIMNVLAMTGMIDYSIKNTADRVYLKDNPTLRSEVAGMWYPFVQLEQRISKDEIIGEIRDYFGNHIADVKSPIDGIVLALRTSPSVGLKEALVYAYEI